MQCFLVTGHLDLNSLLYEQMDPRFSCTTEIKWLNTKDSLRTKGPRQ